MMLIGVSVRPNKPECIHWLCAQESWREVAGASDRLFITAQVKTDTWWEKLSLMVSYRCIMQVLLLGSQRTQNGNFMKAVCKGDEIVTSTLTCVVSISPDVHGS